MKKVIAVLFLLFCVTGCQSLESLNYDKIIENGLAQNDLSNVLRTGYKYYLPKGATLLTNKEFNDEFLIEDTRYYLYVDVVSYFNKVENQYIENPSMHYSSNFENGENYGFLQIKKMENEQYFIEIMYNYAKIEVIVESSSIKRSLAYSMSVLSSIVYNDQILQNIMGDKMAVGNEIEYDIFATAGTENTFLEIISQDEYKEEESDIKDTDLIQ